MSYRVRLLRTDDLPIVTEIYNAACHAKESTHGKRPWSVREMNDFLFESPPSFEAYTCVDNGAVVGWTALTRYRVREDVRHTAEMSLYVQQSFRRRGMGCALANTLLHRAEFLNLHCIFAIVFADMPHAVSFAEKQCGLLVTGRLPEIFCDCGKYSDILVFEKLLAGEPNRYSPG